MSEKVTVDMLDADGNVRCSGCTLQVGRYRSNGNLAVSAITADGEPWGSITVNTPEKLTDDRIAVKDYSEGQGNLRTLVKAGLVEETPDRYIESGFVKIPVVLLTEKGLALVSDMAEEA